METENIFLGQKPIEDNLSIELESLRIKPSDEIPPPPVCIKIKNNDGSDSWFGTLGNISTIIGKAKSRKSFSIALVTATAINNNMLYDKIQGCLPEDQNNVLYFDTEQGKYHVQKAVKRICNLSGVNEPKNLHVFGLRKKKPSERLELIDYAINTFKNVGLVVIDGIKDLITSINDEAEATMITSKLLQWSEEKNIHIVTVLHQNKGNDHARGHIGTELINKSESVFSVTKDEQNKDISIFNAEQCRGKEPESFALSINEYGLPVIEKDYSIGVKKQAVEEFTNDKLWFLISEIYTNGESFAYSELVRQFKVAYKKCYKSKIGDNKIKELITICKNENMIIQEASKKPYFISKDYKPD